MSFCCFCLIVLELFLRVVYVDPIVDSGKLCCILLLTNAKQCFLEEKKIAPITPKSRLASYIPQLDSNISFNDLPHVISNL